MKEGKGFKLRRPSWVRTFKRTFVVHAEYGAGRGGRENMKRREKTNVLFVRNSLSRRKLFSVYGGEPVYRTDNTSRKTRHTFSMRTYNDNGNILYRVHGYTGEDQR